MGSKFRDLATHVKTSNRCNRLMVTLHMAICVCVFGIFGKQLPCLFDEVLAKNYNLIKLN